MNELDIKITKPQLELMKESYNLYVNGEFIKSEYLNIEPEEYFCGEPPAEISNADGTVKYVYANDDDNFQ